MLWYFLLVMNINFTTNEAAIELGVTVRRIRQLYDGGVLFGEKRGRDLFLTRESVMAARHRKTKPGPEKAGEQSAVKPATTTAPKTIGAKSVKKAAAKSVRKSKAK
jgi:hypothetical protein